VTTEHPRHSADDPDPSGRDAPGQRNEYEVVDAQVVETDVFRAGSSEDEVPAADAGATQLPPSTEERLVRTADHWRLVGIGLDAMWVAFLLFVVGFWVRVTWYPHPDDEIRGFVPVILAPAAVVAGALVIWALASAWRLYRRRRSGWDAPLVLGALAVAVAGYSFVPSTTIVPEMLWLGVLGVGSATAAILGERAWRRLR
jgi:cation transport ATPase